MVKILNPNMGTTTSARRSPQRIENNQGARSSQTKPGLPIASPVVKDTTSVPTNHLQRPAEDVEKQPRKEELHRRLRSKILAISAIRKSVRLASVPDEELKSSSPQEAAGRVTSATLNAHNAGEAEGAGHTQEEGGTPGGEADDLRALDILYHPRQNREELRQFLLKAQRETEQCWHDIRQEGSDDVTSRFSVIPGRKENGHARGNARDSDGPLQRTLPPPLPPVDNDIKCDICGELAAFNVPCRVCQRVFHRECLDRCTNCRDRTHIDQALTPNGWSCHYCEDLCLILSAEETAEMMDEFDRCDVNRDESITLDEFVRYKTRQYHTLEGKEMPEEDEGLLRAQFTRMDLDGSESVDWWEFVRFEARRYLARKLEDETVKLLTPKELHHARDIYMSLIMGKEPEESYFQGVYLGSRIMSWEQFLHDQALYILWSRPNRENIIYI